MRVPLFNLFEAGRYSLAPTFYPRLRSLRSLSPGLLRIKPRRGYTLTEKITHVAAGWGYPPAANCGAFTLLPVRRCDNGDKFRVTSYVNH